LGCGLGLAVVSSAVATPCNDKHQDDGESCDHGESFHGSGWLML
jgi:hypothetical protein